MKNKKIYIGLILFIFLFVSGSGMITSSESVTDWFDSYAMSYEIDCTNMDDNVPLVVNGSSGVTINGETQIIWTYCNNGLASLFFNDETDYIVTEGRYGDTIPFEVESGDGISYLPESVWDSDYLMVLNLNQTDIDGGTGDIKDSTSNNNDGTTHNMDSSDQIDGIIDGSFIFDGTNDYLSIGASSFSPSYGSAYTFSLWYYDTGISDYTLLYDFVNSGSTGLMSIFKSDSTELGYPYLCTGYRTSSGNYGAYARIDDLTSYQDEWVHYTTVFDGGTTNTLSNYHIYRNGIELTMTGFKRLGGTASTNIIGAESGGASKYIIGQLDNFELLNVALTSDEINQTYQNAIATSGYGDVKGLAKADWFADYNNRLDIDCSNMNANVPFVVNGSGGFYIDGDNQIVWTYCTGNLNAVYFNDSETYIIVDQDGAQVPFEVEYGNGTSYIPEDIWVNNNEDAILLLNNLTDSTINSHTGTSTGASTTTGKIDGAYNFDGNDYISLADATDLKYTNNFSISAWVYTTDSANYQAICAGTNDPNTGSLTGYYLRKESNNKLYWATVIGSSTTNAVMSNTALSVSTWYHIVVTKSSIQGLSIYINGKLDINEPTKTSNVYYDATTPYFNIGNKNNDGTMLEYWEGKIDELSIYNNVITPSQINQSYQNIIATTGYGTIGTTWRSILGTVKDTSDNGIENAYVVVLEEESNDIMCNYLTDTSGNWHCGVPAGLYSVYAYNDSTDVDGDNEAHVLVY